MTTTTRTRRPRPTYRVTSDLADLIGADALGLSIRAPREPEAEAPVVLSCTHGTIRRVR